MSSGRQSLSLHLSDDINDKGSLVGFCFVSVVIVSHRKADVDAGENAEDKGLNDTDQGPHDEKGHGEEQGQHAGEDDQNRMIADHVATQSQCKGKRAGKVTHQFNGEKKGSENPAPGLTDRVRHVGDVVHAVLSKAVIVVIEENDHATDHCRVEIIGGWNKARNQAD